MFCPSCGVESNQKTNFCKRCGANMNAAANAVEVHLPAAGISGMVWAVAIFSLAGLIASLVGLHELSKPWRNFRDKDVLVALFLCLAFVFSVAGLLIRQLTRLINTYQDAVKRTIDKTQFEMPPQPQAIPTQPQHLYIPPSQESMSSVAEHTTRQMAGVYRDPNVRE
ncbi:MAG: hypothetical protein ACREAB_17870 [Blastocatellia bacterium]